MAGKGGRPRNVPNKNKQALLTRLAEKFPEWDPVVAMAEDANNPELSDELRFNAKKEVAQYIYPKMRSVEHTGDGGAPFQIVIKKYGDNDV